MRSTEWRGAANKYEKNNEGYLKKLFDGLRSHSADPMTDSLKLWNIRVFNYLIGNTDNSVKHEDIAPENSSCYNDKIIVVLKRMTFHRRRYKTTNIAGKDMV